MSVHGPTTLLFDLGGVFNESHTLDTVKGMTGTTVPDDVLTARWLSSPALRAFELGQSSPRDFAMAFLAEWQITVTPDAFLAAFTASVGQPYPGAEALIMGLRNEHKVCCLSNCNALHWPRISPFLACFDAAFSSHLLGEIKPDEAAYLKVMTLLDVSADSLWFFDDSRPNVEAAERLGIRSFVVDGPRGVRRVLEAEGLIGDRHA